MTLVSLVQLAYIVAAVVVVLSAIYLAVYWLYFNRDHKHPAE